MGVMIDDLITRGTAEPYRMFTSRAEYRLQLREDNADLRLTEKGRELGLVDDLRWRAFCDKRERIDMEGRRLQGIWVAPGSPLADSLQSVHGISISKESRALDLLKRPELDYAGLMSIDGLGPGVSDPGVAEQIEIQARYAGYLGRQREDIERRQRHEGMAISVEFDYARVRGLSTEVREKLERVRPDTLGQASRIPGMTPAALSLLLVHLKRTQPHVA
jgi:tRNA uridine 5-carboxymethylaminomethyl modification enzyme